MRSKIVAKKIGHQIRFPSSELSIARGTNYGNQELATLSWSENGIPLAAENDLYVLFNRLFGIDASGKMKQRDNAFQQRGKILDLVQSQTKHLKKRVVKEDQQKLEEDFSSVHEVENQLQRDIDWSAKPKSKPELSNVGDYSRSLSPISREFDYLKYPKLMYDFIALVYKTDSPLINHHVIMLDKN